MGYLTIVHCGLNVYNIPMIGLISCVHLNKAWEFLKHSPFQLEECIHSLYFGIQLIEVRQYSGGTPAPPPLLSSTECKGKIRGINAYEQALILPSDLYSLRQKGEFDIISTSSHCI